MLTFGRSWQLYLIQTLRVFKLVVLGYGCRSRHKLFYLGREMIIRTLSSLLDDFWNNVFFPQDDVLKILGEKHRLYEFLSSLSLKCSYLLFNKEHVKEILLEVDMQKLSGNAQLTLSCMNILVVKLSILLLLSKRNLAMHDDVMVACIL